MAGIARLAKEAGHDVVGSDVNVYPPMSTLLNAEGIPFFNGYDAANIDPTVDCVIVGNVISRGNPAMEYVLDQHLPYMSGPEWLAKNILQKRKVLAVAGTHGKTTTTSLLTWILEHAGLKPGFLIGGVPENFGMSARIGEDPFFVIEADEYDSAFFDKRSKFIHYHPNTLILNNLEFDHADIFPDLNAIKQQFHYLIKTVPGNGLIIHNATDENLSDILQKGCWSHTVTFAGENGMWRAEFLNADGSHFVVFQNDKRLGEVRWNLLGKHNIENALAAIAASVSVGVSYEVALSALPLFKNVKRRLEVKGQASGVTVYDDFAHHPTAIATTLAGLRAKVGTSRIVVVLEFGSYTMRSGVHAARIQKALALADIVFCKRPEADWGLDAILKTFPQPTALFDNVENMVENLKGELQSGDHVVVMSNGGFGGIHQKLLNALETAA
jgi:UDP-N-acetylmuramate: L-alanyl-gamma-D-glutamyl-meso-diaminopimelate ligase